MLELTSLKSYSIFRSIVAIEVLFSGTASVPKSETSGKGQILCMSEFWIAVELFIFFLVSSDLPPGFSFSAYEVLFLIKISAGILGKWAVEFLMNAFDPTEFSSSGIPVLPLWFRQA